MGRFLWPYNIYVELQINASKTKVVHMDKLKHAFLRFHESD